MTAIPVDECKLCELVDGRLETSRVYEDDQAVAFMDYQPVTPGHLLVGAATARCATGEWTRSSVSPSTASATVSATHVREGLVALTKAQANAPSPQWPASSAHRQEQTLRRAGPHSLGHACSCRASVGQGSSPSAGLARHPRHGVSPGSQSLVDPGPVYGPGLQSTAWLHRSISGN